MKKILNSEITPYSAYINRRKFIKSLSTFSIISTLSMQAKAFHNKDSLKYNYLLDEGDKLNTYEEITTYNNFYEFGMGKSDPLNNSSLFNPKPWKIKIEGLVEKPFEIYLEDLLTKITIQDRIYRLRCVEAWSMVIPWQRIPLSDLIKIAAPLNYAKYIQFVTVFKT
jgi:Sulfite oxidase and related enzymes